ncbi:MAG: FAD-dependent oxidoreductase, partial [Gaiellaceae bacterium]
HVTVDNGTKTVHGSAAGIRRSWSAAEIIVAAGRAPNSEGLGLDEPGIEHGPRGIRVEGRLRTSVRSIYATGDVAGRFAFTHSAGYESAQAIRDMFFPGSCKLTQLVPWCTFTDPELANVGLTSEEARERFGEGDVETHTADLADSDRARAEGATEGSISIVTQKGRIVGAHVLSPTAGETIHELALAVNEKMQLQDLAKLIHVYPTISTSINLLAADVAYESATRWSWLIRRVNGSRELASS